MHNHEPSSYLCPFYRHVIPRFAGDDLARSTRAVADADDMKDVAARLRAAWPKDSGAILTHRRAPNGESRPQAP